MRFKAEFIYKLQSRLDKNITFTGKLTELVKPLANGDKHVLSGKDQNGKRCHLMLNAAKYWDVIDVKKN